MRARPLLPTFVALATLALSACEQTRDVLAYFNRNTGAPPDSLPLLLNDSLPFAYPPALYLQLIDDSVTLRLHVDRFGRPEPESTRIEVPAKHAAFDSSALRGSSELVFRPAYRQGKPIPYTVLFPIQFKVPVVPIAPADTTRK
jgi:hypothetical protein